MLLQKTKKPYANSMIRTYPKYGTLAQPVPLLNKSQTWVLPGEVEDLTPAKFIWVFFTFSCHVMALPCISKYLFRFHIK
jgi:hypothetical protein